MSNIVRFLESLGSQPGLSASDYAAAVALLDAEEAQREALVAADIDALSEMLGGRSKMICMIATPDEEQPDDLPFKHDHDEDEEEGEGGEPKQDP